MFSSLRQRWAPSLPPTIHDYRPSGTRKASQLRIDRIDPVRATILAYGSGVAEGEYLIVAKLPGEDAMYRIDKLIQGQDESWEAELVLVPRATASRLLMASNPHRR